MFQDIIGIPHVFANERSSFIVLLDNIYYMATLIKDFLERLFLFFIVFALKFVGRLGRSNGSP